MIGARCWVKVRKGVLVGSFWLVCLEKEVRPDRDQTLMLESAEPETRKSRVESATSDVTGCRCAAAVVVWRPVDVFKRQRFGDKLRDGSDTHLPYYQPTPLCSDRQRGAGPAASQRDAVHALMQRHRCLLVSAPTPIYMQDSLARLRCKHMGV